jgi:hypothetical protein
MRVQLSVSEAERLRRPVNGRGGFQSLLRRVQRSLTTDHIIDVTDQDFGRLVRYFFEYGYGGFQSRTPRRVMRGRVVLERRAGRSRSAPAVGGNNHAS